MPGVNPLHLRVFVVMFIHYGHWLSGASYNLLPLGGNPIIFMKVVDIYPFHVSIYLLQGVLFHRENSLSPQPDDINPLGFSNPYLDMGRLAREASYMIPQTANDGFVYKYFSLLPHEISFLCSPSSNIEDVLA